ncbi:MAG: DUF4340 domain-containing protein [Betaproteobacteria bacterium]|jgi:hypothetical protein|nr:MAG: DUF4340 domain-containing protein [Betaproteobacteria bacterium]
MKSRLILNLVLLLALVALGLYAYLRPGEQQEPGIAVSQLERGDVVRVTIKRGTTMDVEMAQRDGRWLMLRPYQTRVEPLQLARVLDLAEATASDVLPADNLPRYGLDPPAARVTLNDQAFAFGAINEITNEQYLASGDHIYLVRTFLGYNIPLDVTKLLSHKLLGESEKPVEFNFGDWQAVKNDKGAWLLRGNSPTADDDAPTPDELNVWAAEWNLASALSVEPYQGTPRGERITIQLGNGTSATFRVMSRQPEVKLLRVEENMLYRLGADAGGRLLDPYRVAAS